MRILHCADLHLDSSLISNLSEDKARERRDELFKAFVRLLDFGSENKVDAVIIAGDLFDKGEVSRTRRDMVLSEISRHKDMTFFYVRGNHDRGFEGLGDLPENLCLFGRRWTRYGFNTEGRRLVIAGREMGDDTAQDISEGLSLKTEDINILVLHGQVKDYEDKKDAETIALSLFSHKNIDYLALGHIHEYSQGRLDSRGIYCYSGCLEGRGFDECGPKGAVLLDIDTESGRVKHGFIDMSIRRLHDCRVDTTGINSMVDLEIAITSVLEDQGVRESDLVKLSLVGRPDASFAVNKEYIERVYRDSFYFVKVKDMTSRAMPEKELGKTSLSGEFLRLLKEREDISQEQKERIASLGLSLLKGENVL